MVKCFTVSHLCSPASLTSKAVNYVFAHLHVAVNNIVNVSGHMFCRSEYEFQV